MTDVSSCRPARLLRFEETIGAIIEGLHRRAGDLEDTLAEYHAGCSPEFRVDTTGTAAALRAWTTQFGEFGTWVGDVGRGFMTAEAIEAYMYWDPSVDFEDVITQSDVEIIDQLPDEYDDPFLNVPDLDPGELFGDEDPDGPPAWLSDLQAGGNLAFVLQHVYRGTSTWLAGIPPGTTMANGTLLVTGESASRVLIMSRWLGRVSNAATFIVGAGTQWASDAELPTGERVLRAGTRGLFDLGGFAAGAAGGAALCGPGAPVCATVAGIVGGFVGGFLGDMAADLMPWMDDPVPGEHDLERLEDEIAGDDEDLDVVLMATIDLGATDVALAETAVAPEFHAQVSEIVPDRDVLLNIIDPPEATTPTRTTTTTTTTAPTATTATTATTTTTTSPPSADDATSADAEGPPPGTTTTTVADEAPTPWPDGAPYPMPQD